MDPAVAGALVAAGFTAFTSVTTQLIAVRRERLKEIAAKQAADELALRETLEPAAMVLNAAIRAAETAVDSGRKLPLADISDPETERLSDGLASGWQLEARLALRLRPDAPTSAAYTDAMRHLHAASQTSDPAQLREELRTAAAQRDRFVNAAAEAFGVEA